MKKTTKIIAVIISVLITLLILIKFISLLDFISFDFGIIGDVCRIGWQMPGWILGFVGCGLDTWLCKKKCDSKLENFVFRASAVFCMLVVLLDLFMLYVISQI